MILAPITLRNPIMKKINIIISTVLIIFSGFYAFLTTNLPTRNLPNTLGITFMPWVLVICLLGLSILLLFNTIFRGTKEEYNYHISLKEGSGILSLTAIVFLYVKAMNVFGYLLITPIFVAILMLICGSRKWKEIVIISIVGSFGVYFFFQKIFQVLLPDGTIF